MGDTVEGIFILDDIVGFINEEHYKEFAHPYLKRICDAFPKDWVKLYHNDAEVDACLDHLPDAGFNVPELGQAEGHPRGEAARRRSHVPDGQRQSARDRRARHAGRSEGSDARRARGRRAAKASSSRSAAAPAPACRAATSSRCSRRWRSSTASARSRWRADDDRLRPDEPVPLRGQGQRGRADDQGRPRRGAARSRRS